MTIQSFIDDFFNNFRKWCKKCDRPVVGKFSFITFTSENFNLSGNIPVDRILLNMFVKGDEPQVVLAFRILDDISS